LHVLRFAQNPIVRAEMMPGSDGDNINGPSLIRVPDWITNRLGNYYLYFAHHQGTYIRLAYADGLEGPWKIFEPGTLRLEEAPGCEGHIASPDVHVDDERREIRMYFHGPAGAVTTDRRQRTFVAVSPDGLHFTATDAILGNAYWRAFRWDDWWYAMGGYGRLYRSRDGLNDFQEGPNPFPQSPPRDKKTTGLLQVCSALRLRRKQPTPATYSQPSRHLAVHQSGRKLWVYFSNIGDAPERILRCGLDVSGDWNSWTTSSPEDVLRPETEWEGALLPVKPSLEGAMKGPENALRDPAIFVEHEHVYLLYAVAGESGIAIAECVPKP
jgi:hypothetical protein